MSAAALSPYARTLGIARVVDDATLLRLPFADRVVGRPGFLHGGAIAGLLEAAIFLALQQETGDDIRARPISVTVDYIRGGRDKDSFARARVTRIGSKVAAVEATAWQDDPDRPIGSARMNLLVDRPPA